MGGFFLLLFNPSAWATVAGSLLIGLIGGVWIEAKISHADMWKANAIAYKQAAENSQAISLNDSEQANKDRERAEKAEAVLRELLNSNENGNSAVCSFSESQLNSLRLLINPDNSSSKLKVPAISKRPAK